MTEQFILDHRTPMTDPLRNIFVCSNCSDCINGRIKERVCTLITDHKPVLCVEDSNKGADWIPVTKKVSE